VVDGGDGIGVFVAPMEAPLSTAAKLFVFSAWA